MDLLVPQPRPKESNREYACRVLRMNIMTFRLKPGRLAIRLSRKSNSIHK